MLTFILGVVLGGGVGTIVTSLCAMAKRADEKLSLKAGRAQGTKTNNSYCVDDIVAEVKSWDV